MDAFRDAGILLVSMHLFQKLARGVASECLHIFRRTAGTPSGPDAELFFSSSIASIISSGSMVMLFIGRLLLSMSGDSLDGLLNTELYWLAKMSAISALFVVI